MGSAKKKHVRQIYVIFRKDMGEHETVAGYITCTCYTAIKMLPTFQNLCDIPLVGSTNILPCYLDSNANLLLVKQELDPCTAAT